MICKVMYWREQARAYMGNEYTYRSDLPLREFDEVYAPTEKEPKAKALVMKVNLPESTISPEWADKVKEIVAYVDGDSE